LLLGRIVNAIELKQTDVVFGIAAGVAGLALFDAALGLGQRWYSARVGEGLIYDLRTAVFQHVQRQPIAFFTRAQTGSLVSRLNSDVIGAQQALTSTLSGVVSNALTLPLVLIAMLSLSWLVTVVSLVLLPMFVIFFVSALAETNRTPFDLPMSEAELVAGFHTEYSAMTFGLFFLGEYANMILLSALGAVLFLGGWMSPIPFAPFTWIPGLVWFALKIAFLLFVFSWTKGTLPRYRYDQLMRLGWKVFLPVSLGWVVLTAGVLQFAGWVPKH
jgi:hypothetical protein